MRSVSDGDAAAVLERRTIDGSNDLYVLLQFDNAHKVKFENEAWSEIDLR